MSLADDILAYPTQSAIREEPCACGGAITLAWPATDEQLARAVWQHINRPRHHAWREREEHQPKRDAYEDRLR